MPLTFVKNEKVKEVADTVISLIIYICLFLIIFILIISIIKFYLSSVIPFLESKDKCNQFVLSNTGAILTCITLPITVTSTLLAKPIQSIIKKFIDLLTNLYHKDIKINESSTWLKKSIVKLCNSTFVWAIIIPTIIAVIDCLLFTHSPYYCH